MKLLAVCQKAKGACYLRARPEGGKSRKGLDMESDTLIIGGGIVGTAIARELSKYQAKTTLIEKEADIAFGGPTKANTARATLSLGTERHSRNLKEIRTRLHCLNLCQRRPFEGEAS